MSGMTREQRARFSGDVQKVIDKFFEDTPDAHDQFGYLRRP